MNLGAVIKSFIYVISGALLYPTLVLLVLLTVLMLVNAGSIVSEFWARLRLKPTSPDHLATALRAGETVSILSIRVRNYIEALKALLAKDQGVQEPVVEKLLQDHVAVLWKPIDRLRVVVRVGPGLGLVGTLIPMGTGLASLGQGDIQSLSADLVVAFTTTVVGLTLGMVAFFFLTVKKRWAEADQRTIEFATEVLVSDKAEPLNAANEPTPPTPSEP